MKHGASYMSNSIVEKFHSMEYGPAYEDLRTPG